MDLKEVLHRPSRFFFVFFLQDLMSLDLKEVLQQTIAFVSTCIALSILVPEP